MTDSRRSLQAELVVTTSGHRCVRRPEVVGRRVDATCRLSRVHRYVSGLGRIGVRTDQRRGLVSAEARGTADGALVLGTRWNGKS